jgi:hypothetical protein
MSVCGRRCKTCIFFEEEFGREGKGECHRFPPQFAVVECGYSTSKYYRFPRVNEYYWCGEWSDKIN